MLRCLYLLGLTLSCIFGQSYRAWRLCTSNVQEQAKCERIAADSSSPTLPVTSDVLKCVNAGSKTGCFELVKNGSADMVTVDGGLAYTAGHLFNLRPIAYEVNDRRGVQGTSEGAGLADYSVAIIEKQHQAQFRTLANLKGKKACFAGVDYGASWTLPISELLSRNAMRIEDCGSSVKIAARHFGDMCAPGSRGAVFNQFGDNPLSSCNACGGTRRHEFCVPEFDPYSGDDGAIRCLVNHPGSIAFARDAALLDMTDNPNNNVSIISNSSLTTKFRSDFLYLCPDGSTRPITDDTAATCNWGAVVSSVVMASILIPDEYTRSLQTMLNQLNAASAQLQLFNSEPWCRDPQLGPNIQICRRNLLFTDSTSRLVTLTGTGTGTQINPFVTYEDYVDQYNLEFTMRLKKLEECPLLPVRLCVISQREMIKCEQMKINFGGRKLKPDLDCVLATGTLDCMKKIADGNADLVNLDPGDAYVAGKDFAMVPIAAEDYGDNTNSLYVVAIAAKADAYSTLFNLKNRKVCLPAVGTAVGWYIPVTSMIQSDMVRVFNCDIPKALGSFFLRGCIPGILDSRFDPKGTNPIELCGSCGSGGPDKCQRDSREQYYGTTGAFRCLVEGGGDISFVKHTTVLDNSDGRNDAIWARNRRSDDYQLLCLDGGRKSVWDWRECNLANVPSKMLMTAGFKTEAQRLKYWNLLNYAQNYFASSVTSDFSMFDSGTNDNDLIFSDSTVRLSWIPPEKQQYDKWLSASFLNAVRNLHSFECEEKTYTYQALGNGAAQPLVGVLLVLTASLLPTLWS